MVAVAGCRKTASPVAIFNGYGVFGAARGADRARRKPPACSGSDHAAASCIWLGLRDPEQFRVELLVAQSVIRPTTM